MLTKLVTTGAPMPRQAERYGSNITMVNNWIPSDIAIAHQMLIMQEKYDGLIRDFRAELTVCHPGIREVRMRNPARAGLSSSFAALNKPLSIAVND